MAYCMSFPTRAFSGKVDTGFPQKMRPTQEARARFRFHEIETRSCAHDKDEWAAPPPTGRDKKRAATSYTQAAASRDLTTACDTRLRAAISVRSLSRIF